MRPPPSIRVAAPSRPSGRPVEKVKLPAQAGAARKTSVIANSMPAYRRILSSFVVRGEARASTRRVPCSGPHVIEATLQERYAGAHIGLDGGPISVDSAAR